MVCKLSNINDPSPFEKAACLIFVIDSFHSIDIKKLKFVDNMSVFNDIFCI